jgi:HK97 family phage prohead protease
MERTIEEKLAVWRRYRADNPAPTSRRDYFREGPDRFWPVQLGPRQVAGWLLRFNVWTDTEIRGLSERKRPDLWWWPEPVRQYRAYWYSDCFDRNLTGAGSRRDVFRDHDTDQHLGHSVEITPHKWGLWCKVEIANTVSGDDALRQALNGRLGFSIGADDLDVDMRDEDHVTYIHRRLMVLNEISLTPEPNNEYARVVAVGGQYAAESLSVSVLDSPGMDNVRKGIAWLRDKADLSEWKRNNQIDSVAMAREAELRQQAKRLATQFGLA